MASIKLETYSIRIKPKGDKKEYLVLDEIFDENFISFLEKYANSFGAKIEVDEQSKRSIQFKEGSLRIASEKRFISGILESGEYGIGGTIVDTNTSKKRYEKSITDADTKPFYFLIYAPEGETKGILVLQRFGINGIHTIFRQHFGNFVRSNKPDCVLELSPLIPKELLELLLKEGVVKSITELNALGFNENQSIILFVNISDMQIMI